MDDEIKILVPDDEWLIIHKGDTVMVWNLGQPGNAREDLIHRGRVAAGIPADHDWADGGWSVGIGFGRPHEKLMARATVGTVADLGEVGEAEVAEHRDALAEIARQDQIEAAKTALAALDPAALAAVLEHPDVVALRTAT